jgi:hypothetical protein
MTADSIPSLLFFCRGRGRGHAIPDAVIAGRIREQDPRAQIRFVSYATGARTLVDHGFPTLDLDLPEDAPFLSVLVAATRVMAAGQRADLVVSHEEFAVLPVAKALGFPTCLVVDFFPWSDLGRHSLRHADRIAFIEQPGIFGEPPEVQGRVAYTGPVVRPLVASRTGSAAAREALGIGPGTVVVSVIPGAYATEERAPILDLVSAAFRRLEAPDKLLVWVAGTDHRALAGKLGDVAPVRVLEQYAPIERLMVASNVVITKSNRGTTIDLARLGVPSLSLSHGLNQIDEVIVRRIRTNLALDARGLDPAVLASYLLALVGAGESPAFVPDPQYQACGSAEVARVVLGMAHAAAARRASP